MKTIHSILFEPSTGALGIYHRDEDGYAACASLTLGGLSTDLQAQAGVALDALNGAIVGGETPAQVVIEKGPIIPDDVGEGIEPGAPVQQYLAAITAEATGGSRTRTLQCIPAARAAIGVLWASIETQING